MANPGDTITRRAPSESSTADSVQRMVGLLTDGIAAAEGAQVIIELYFQQQDRDPVNNDNYCRLLDWLKAARRHRDKQANND